MKLRLLAVAVLLSLLAVSCSGGRGHGDSVSQADLPDIRKRGELVVLTLNSSTSYFSYRGEPMGFQYELARQFAHSLGLRLKLKVVKQPADLVRCLLRGEGDLIAYNLEMTHAWKDSLIYCGEEDITHQVLVQRSGAKVLTDVTQLVGKDVYAVPGKYADRLHNLDEELGGGIRIHVVQADTVSDETLITWVAEGKIDYTVTSNEVARINRTYYSDLDIRLAVSFDQRASWAVRKTSPQLARAADNWHRRNIHSAEFRTSARRYFELNKRTPLQGGLLSVREGRISHYDSLFRKYASEIGWDWRLLASLAYTESNFNPDAVSWSGARGIMQLMPATARAMGVRPGHESDPEESIRAAVKYIERLDRAFARVTDASERLKFVLAAYNAGTGHITDAMALAAKYGRNRFRWEHHVDHYVLLKSNPEYYQDPVCRYGYFRGTETYNFVRNVLARADEYRRLVKK